MNSYSQPYVGQDRWILEEVFVGHQNGFFVDVGAGDGIDHSNTYALEQTGWKGLCIEADDANFTKLKMNRSCICEHACILDQRQEVDFLVVDQNQMDGLGHLFCGIKNFLPAYPLAGKMVKKKTVPLDSVLRKHNVPKLIEYLNLDVEGAEFEVLKNFPFDEFTFTAITVEHNAHLGDASLQKNLRQLLLENGYVLAKSLKWDDWYLRKTYVSASSSKLV